MANQAIALQARAPQSAGLGPAIAQNAQMINMMAQQRAAERQAAQAQQTMDIEAAKEARGVETHTAEMRAKSQAYRDAELKQLRNIGVSVLRSGSEPAYQAWVGEIEKVDRRFADTIRQISPTFNPDVMKYIISEADAYLQKNTSQRVAKEVFDEQGNLIVMDIGGDTPSRIEPGIITNIPNPQGSAPMGGPAEETAAPMAAADNRSLSQVVSSALETGVMAKTDFDKLLSIAQPESRAKIADWVRSNNIEVMDTPGEMRVSPMSYDGQTPQAEFAVLRGAPPQSRTASLRDAPPMEQTLAQYQVGQQVRGRNPSMPPSANVPIERVRQESVARRPSPAEEAARKTAELEAQEAFNERNREAILRRERDKVFAAERAKKDAEFMEGYSGARDRSLSAVDLIGQMIGDLRVENNKLVLPKGGRRPHGGFESVIGAGIPGLRFIPGTQSADFDAKLDQIEGGAFLEAYESLKGTGQITEIEGTKATNAIQRMKRSTSEVEFVRAAREFENIIRRGLERAQKRYSGLTGAPVTGTPTKTKARTPTGSSIPKDIADMYGL